MKLLEHFKRMQEKATEYLVPDSNIKDLSFAGDMVYMLDCPEQREAQAEAEFDYIAETELTASGVYGGRNSDSRQLAADLHMFIVASQRLDMHKKVLFRMRDPSEVAPWLARSTNHPTSLYFKDADIDLIHGIVGIVTEAGELAEIAYNKLNKGDAFEIDVVNVKEECGDILWYMARLMKWGNTDFITEMMRNIKKLRNRHGNSGFNKERDIKRDLEAEHKLLAQKPEFKNKDELIEGQRNFFGKEAMQERMSEPAKIEFDIRDEKHQ
jgi:NTP pyrophosphatase (non-canonical NTP hydrolase)